MKKTNQNLSGARVALAVGLLFNSLPVGADPPRLEPLVQEGTCPQATRGTAQDANRAAIPWSQLGAKARADYQGDGLSTSPTAEGARLRCVFQRLEGEATPEGLWLTSTVIPPSGTANERFRVVAAAVGRVTISTAGNPLTPAPLPLN